MQEPNSCRDGLHERTGRRRDRQLDLPAKWQCRNCILSSRIVCILQSPLVDIEAEPADRIRGPPVRVMPNSQARLHRQAMSDLLPSAFCSLGQYASVCSAQTLPRSRYGLQPVAYAFHTRIPASFPHGHPRHATRLGRHLVTDSVLARFCAPGLFMGLHTINDRAYSSSEKMHQST